jgi:hypothetical protein
MSDKKKPWFWNVALVLTVIICAVLLLSHYKNWITEKPQELRIISGFYHVSLPYKDLDSVVWTAKLPPMERLHGFSALQKEKGVFREFKDSLTNKKVYVFVDNIAQQKIKLVYRDSSYLFLNLKDSTATLALFNRLLGKMPLKEPLN